MVVLKSMETKAKHIKVNKPMPDTLKKAIQAKKEWQLKVRSGETSAPASKGKRLV